MQNHRVLAALALVLSCQGVARAQIVSGKRVGDKTVMCMHTGLTSDHKDCGAQADWYTYVFVGLISAVTPIENDEKGIQVVPEEVFLGAPSSPMMVLTSQANCFPELKAGDRWLFYLRKVNGKPVVLDYYANDSLPLADAQEQIATLRRLEKIGDFAVLRGRVQSKPFGVGVEAVPNAHIIANRRSDDKRYVCITGADGRYEFQPLPPGKYKIRVRPIGSYKPDDNEINLTRGACWDLMLSRYPHAQLGGHVRRSNGSPVANVDVVLIRSDNSFETDQTDPNGGFMFDSQEPGEYVLGLNYPRRPDWFNGSGGGPGGRIPPASVFYPGVANRANARVIRLATDEKLHNLDFIVPVK